MTEATQKKFPAVTAALTYSAPWSTGNRFIGGQSTFRFVDQGHLTFQGLDRMEFNAGDRPVAHRPLGSRRAAARRRRMGSTDGRMTDAAFRDIRFI